MSQYNAVGQTLAEVSRALGQLTDDRMTRQVLETNAVHLQLGAVRLMLLGSSGAGKSTMINALLRCIAVPESGLTSSPIPVWFTAGAGTRYSVYEDTDKGPLLLEEPERLEKAKEEGITVLASEKTAYELCALMAEKGLPGSPREA